MGLELLKHLQNQQKWKGNIQKLQNFNSDFFFPGNLWSWQTNNSDSDGACGGWGRGYGSPVAVSDKEISTAPIFSASPHTLQPRNLGSLEVFGGLNVIFEISTMQHNSYLYSRHILAMFDWYQDYGQSSMFCIPYLSDKKSRQKSADACISLAKTALSSSQ